MRYGGATDATNVIRTTKMAVLTSISLDHVGVLGDDLLEIAANKAGIIKPGAIVVMGRQEPQVEDAVWAICMEKGNPFIAAKPQEAVVRDVTVEHQTFRYHGRRDHNLTRRKPADRKRSAGAGMHSGTLSAGIQCDE